MVKRISLIVVCTAIAFFAFSFHSESKADKEENEEKEEEVDFQNIPLTSKQLNAIDLKLGEAQKRELDAMLHVNGTLVLRAQNMADVASLMGGVVKSISVKEGQQINKGQVVATIENTEIVSLQKDYYSAYKKWKVRSLKWKDRKHSLHLELASKRNCFYLKKTIRWRKQIL